MRILKGVKIVVAKEEVLRLQGFRKGNLPGTEVSRILEDMIARGRRLIQPESIYAEVGVKNITEELIELDNGLALSPGNLTRFFRGCDYLGMVLCTIGPALENQVAELFAQKDFASALMLDSVGSVAVENLADQINHFICHRIGRVSDKATPNLSPGYGDWTLSDQRVLFTILPGAEIGISLNEQCMMIPRKSVSFCVGIGNVTDTTFDHCQYCSFKDCEYRRPVQLMP